MRRTLGMIALLTALASAPACLSQDLQQQQDTQQRDVEQRLEQRVYTPAQDQYRAMAKGARRQAEQARTPDSKAKFLKSAEHWDRLALVVYRPLQTDR